MEKKDLYNKKVMKYFLHPRNYGKIENADGVGKVGNKICGDVMYVYIKVGKNKKKEEIIKDVKFETFGCVAAVATSSVVTDLAKNKTLESALKISKTEVVNFLGGLPQVKVHCSVLAADALTEAIYDYFTKNEMPISKELEEKHLAIKKQRAHEEQE